MLKTDEEADEVLSAVEAGGVADVEDCSSKRERAELAGIRVLACGNELLRSDDKALD